MPSPEDRAAVLARVHAELGRLPLARRAGAERLARLAGLKALWRAYDGMAPGGQAFEARLLDALGIAWRVGEGRMSDIPPAGPLLVVATHPSGGAEALVAQALLSQRREDWRVLANRHLAVLPELAPRLVGVAPGGGGAAMRAALGHLRSGGTLLMFPAGTVAHWQRGRGYGEAPWHPSARRLAASSGASVLPLDFTVRTTLRWRVLSGLSRRARTILLPRELLAQRGRCVEVAIGPLMTRPERIEAFLTARA